ncbi:hypothetical protein LTR39_001870 [Cryomyces antarcticus]|nr:hypothetical protein LTR39_001870 [Cryomyces antarcticus]
MATDPAPLVWGSAFSVTPTSRTPLLRGDKILLPPSALEQLLSAAPVVTSEPTSTRPYTSSFSPYNPHSYAAEIQARAQFQEQQHQLPHPLTFRLANPQNGRSVYAGIREFSAEEGEVGLSPFLREALGLNEVAKHTPAESGHIPSDGNDDVPMTNGGWHEAATERTQPRINIHARQLPKGAFVKLRPLEAGYDPEDWKSLLEQHLRANFTTMTNGEILVVPGGSRVGGKKEEFRFLIDGFAPEGDGICVVDTDLEVDIEALNEEQARETLRKIATKLQRAPGTQEGSSVGDELDLFNAQQGQVVEGEYVDYQISSWDRSQGIEIEVSDIAEDDEIDLFVSPLSSRQRRRPREDECVLADVEGRPAKRIRLAPTNVELEDAEALWVSVHAHKLVDSLANGAATPNTQPKHFTIRAKPLDPGNMNYTQPDSATTSKTPPNPDEVRCKNCHQWIPQRTLFLHENFCIRNNILCPKGCNQVFQKRSEAWQNHWHCPHDSAFGNTALSHSKHDHLFHPPVPYECAGCGFTAPNIRQLALHKTSTCPAKPILCRFCHLQVPQQSDTDPDASSPEVLLSGLTPHELADGARTTECHLCNKITRLRDMSTHLRHHDLERLSRPPPRLCRNVLCGRTLDGVGKNGVTRLRARGPENDIGLCDTCIGPLYVSMYDPDGKALRRRVERRYLSQLLAGCGHGWCSNRYCKTGRKNTGGAGAEKGVSAKDAIPMIKPFLDGLATGEAASPLHFCVDESSQRRRELAEMLAAEEGGVGGKGGYSREWCVGALEAEGGDLDRARAWLKGWALRRDEVRS